MKDKNGIEITLGKLARYIGDGWNSIVDYMRIRRKHPIPSDPNYILSLEEIKIISPIIYFQLMHGKFEIPYLFQIDIAELEEELNLEIGKMYYSDRTNKFYFYRGWNSSYFIREIRDFKFTFEIASSCGQIVRRSPFNYGESSYEGLLISNIKELELKEADCVYLNLGDCYYSPDKRLNIRYTCGGLIGTYHFENEWEELVVLSFEELKRLIPIESYNRIKLKDIKVYVYENMRISVFREYISGYYRGEDSGARYPEYDEEFICQYDLVSLKNEHKKTIQAIANAGLAHEI